MTIDFLERSIASILPTVAEKRAASRLRTKITEETSKQFSAYDAGRRDRTTQDWEGLYGSADADIIPDLATMRARSRDLIENSGWGAGMQSKLVTNVIGTGLMPKFHFDHTALKISAKRARKLEYEVTQFFLRWVPFSDAARTVNFFGGQRRAYDNRRRNGEYLTQPVLVDNIPDNEIGLALFDIESDRLDAGFHVFSNNRVDSGVEIDQKYGAPIAYHIAKCHPGDTFQSSDPNGFIRVPAFDVDGRRLMLHGYDAKRAGQTRGVPALAPVLIEMNNAKLHRNAEQIAARIAACFGLVINNGGTPITGGLEDINGQTVNGMEPGMIVQTASDLDITQVAPIRPGPGFAPFMHDAMRSSAMSQGAAFEILYSNFSNSTYTALRAAFTEAEKFYNVERAKEIHTYCNPIIRWFLDLLVFKGLVRLPNYIENRQLYMPKEYTPPPRDQIDPFREAQASKISVDERFTSREQEIRKRGSSGTEALFDQISREKEMMQRLGIADQAEQRETDKVLAGLGLEMSAQDTYERYHREAPADGEKILTPPMSINENIQIDETTEAPEAGEEPEEPTDG